jgi:hypothetical protein
MELSFENDIGSQNFKFFKKNDYKSFTGSSLRAKPTQCYNLIKTQESHLILLQNKSKDCRFLDGIKQRWASGLQFHFSVRFYYVLAIHLGSLPLISTTLL